MSTGEGRISLRVKVPAEGGTAVVEMTGPAAPENGLQAFGDWVLAALEQHADGAAEAARPLIAALREVADAHSATPAQVALAWVIRHPAVVAIPGAASVEQLESNVAAAEIDLADDQYQALSDAAARFRPLTGAAVLPRLARARLGR